MSVGDEIKTGLKQAIELETRNNIAKDLCSQYKICTCNNRDGHCATPQQHAKIIYELGYRKEEDVIREVQNRIDEAIKNSQNTSININTADGMQMLITKVLKDYLSEVKQRKIHQ